VTLEPSFLFSTVTPGQLPTYWLLPVRALNIVVLPLFGLPASAMVMLTLVHSFSIFMPASLNLRLEKAN
jgi:hypothetical protein